MCGISGYFATEEKPSISVICDLLNHGKLRGTDAFGYTVVSRLNNSYYINDSKKSKSVDNSLEHAIHISDKMSVGSVVLSNHRAAPETETESKDDNSIQPIIDRERGIILVHNGAVSNSVYNDLRKRNVDSRYPKVSDIDSEAIIWAYAEKGRNMKLAMEYLSGGFAFLMIDLYKKKLYAVCTHNPLYCGYVRGHGLFFSSLKEGCYSVVSNIKGLPLNKMNISHWEDYYVRELPGNTITEFDLNSTMVNEIKFEPRYITPVYDTNTIKRPHIPRRAVLVAASSGLDSTTTMVLMKYAGYDVIPVHFKYGHRGQDCESIAINNICKELKLNPIVFDIEYNMRRLDPHSMLMDNEQKITTGTEEGLKTTAAWTCFRNGFFVTYMGALAESLITSNNYDEVYITGGFMNLTESGTYPDNSERFINAFQKFAEFSSICGSRIKIMHGCANLLKSEQYYLLDLLGLNETLGRHMISCDRPKVIDGIPCNCSKDGEPACGSGKLSVWAAKLAGVKDPRRYYDVDDANYNGYVPPSSLTPKAMNLDVILSKIQMHQENMQILSGQIRKVISIRNEQIYYP